MAILLAIALLCPVEGYATYYDPGLMQQVAEYRGMSLDGYVGGVALNSCDVLGTKVYLWFGRGPIMGPFKVVDCAQPKHKLIRESQNRIVEVDSKMARKFAFYKVGPIRVLMWQGSTVMKEMAQ